MNVHTVSTPLRAARAWIGPDDRFLLGGRLRRPLILMLYASLLALALVDKYVQEFRVVWAQALMIVLVLLDLPSPRSWKASPFPQRLLLSLGLLALTIALASICFTFAGSAEFGWRGVWEEIDEYEGIELWLASLWLFSGIVPWPAARRDPEHAALCSSRWSYHVALALVLFGLWSWITAYTSLRPDRSFTYFGIEIGIYLPLFLFWVRHGSADPGLRPGLLRVVLILFALVTISGFCVGALYLTGPPDLRSYLESFNYNFSQLINHQFIDGQDQWRLVFPFGHHNRMGYFSMLATLLFAAAGFACQSGWRLRTVFFLLAAMAFVDMLMTLNRGAALGLVTALLCIAIARWGRRALIPVVVAVALVVLFLPGMQRARLLSIFNPRTYVDRQSTVNYRFVHIKVAFWMIDEHPWFGIGYGWKHFEKTYAEFYQRRTGIAPAHAHNVWIQITAESGIPAFLLYLLFHALRWWLFLRVWRNRAQLTPAERHRLMFWIGLEVAVQVFCMVNYPLRRSLGLITWIGWAVMTTDLIALQLASTRRSRIDAVALNSLE